MKAMNEYRNIKTGAISPSVIRDMGLIVSQYENAVGVAMTIDRDRFLVRYSDYLDDGWVQLTDALVRVRFNEVIVIETEVITRFQKAALPPEADYAAGVMQSSSHRSF